MDNKINFTGIKNTGIIRFSKVYPQLNYVNLVTQLTDDFNGKDLSEFYTITKKMRNSVNIPNFKYDRNFINIMCEYFHPQERKLPNIYINGTLLPSKDETLPMYTFIAEITRRLQKLVKNKELIINQDYKYGDDAKLYLANDKDLAKRIKDGIVETVFSPDTIKKDSKLINDTITLRMCDYFDML